MRKLAAIILICLLAFNWYGYRLVTGFMADNASSHLEAQLDASNYNEADLVEVNIPLNVPYQNLNSDFERHYGEVEVNGVFYTYVKSKVENGNLVLKCIPNEQKKDIRDAGNDYYKKTNGLDQEQSGKKTSNTFAKQSVSDYDDQLETFALNAPVVSTEASYADYCCVLAAHGVNIPGQPPEA